MEHKSLYRKYRPQQFDDLLGQNHVTRTLQNALSSQPPSIVHAYLFCGPRGTGKTTTARILAMALNCVKGPTESPCGECESCADIARGSAMDVLEIDAASHTGVDNVRDVIISKVNFKPALGRYRMYIIDEAHQLSSHAFNALLKTIEEPPPHAVFVLATTEFQKVPVTIQSRCQRFLFNRVRSRDIAERIRHVAQKEGVNIDSGAVDTLARAADGSLRDGLSLLEQVIAYSGTDIREEDVHLILGTVSADQLDSLLERIEANDASGAIELSRTILSRGISCAYLAHSFAGHVRDRFVSDLAAGDESSQRERLDLMERFAEAEGEMRWNASHELLLELAILKSCVPQFASAVPKETVSSVQSVRKQTSQQARTGDKTSATGRQNKAPDSDTSHQGTTEPITNPATDSEYTPSNPALQELWTKVLDRVKQKGGLPLHAFLMEGKPLMIEEDRLVVVFEREFEFHRQKVAEPARRRIVEEVMQEFTTELPAQVKLDCRLAGKEVLAVPHETAKSGDLLAQASALFPDSQIIE